MSTRRSRRLFRAALGRGGRRLLSAPVLVLVVALGAAGVVAVVGLPADLFGRVPALSGTITADPQAVAVVDGDTLRLNETVVRLLGVQAPRRGAACRSASGATLDCGAEAATALGRMLYGKGVVCRLDGRDPHGLPRGACEAGTTAVNQAVVAAGWARADEHGNEALREEEQRARAARRGVWRSDAAPVF